MGGKGGRPSSLWVEGEGVRVAGKEERVEGLVLWGEGEGEGVRLALMKDGGREGEVEEEVVGRKGGGWVGEGLGEVGSMEEAEWEVWRNVVTVLMTKGEGRSGKVGNGLADAIVARMDALRGQMTGDDARPTGAELLLQLDQHERSAAVAAKPSV